MKRLAVAAVAAFLFVGVAYVAAETPSDAVVESYIVQPGDNFYLIADAVAPDADRDVAAEYLSRANGYPDTIYPGEVLWFAPSDMALNPPPTTTSTSTTTPSTTTVATTTTTQPTPTQAPTTTAAPTTTVVVTIPAEGFVETFDTEASLDRFDYQVHHAWTANSTKSAWPGDHDASCGPAGSLRQVDNPTAIDGQTHYPGMGPDVGVVYWCQPAGANAHMMTSFNTSHYAQVNFAPKPTFNDADKVCWDQNRTDLGSRHWTQLVVVPLDTFEANDSRLDYVASRFSPSGPGKYGIHPTDETLLVEFGRGKPRVQIGQSVQDINGLAWNAGSDKASRFEHCVENTAGGLRVTIDGGTGPIAYNYQGSLPSGDVRVVFQQDLYNPDKAPGTPNAYTWHWDNIIIDTD